MEDRMHMILHSPAKPCVRVLLLLSLLWLGSQVPAQGQFTQQGKASYYADKFQGRSTASGERYSAQLHTCAHMSLPFGTVLEVVNVKNGKTTLVRVNDRGPFAPDRIIDVSRVAAQELGMLSEGVIEVKITTVPASRLSENGNPLSEQTSVPQIRTEDTASKPTLAVEKRTEPTVHATPGESPKQPTPVPTPPPTPEPASTSSSLPLYALQVSQVPGGGFGVQVASYNTLANVLNRLIGMPPAEQKLIRVMVDEQSTPHTFKLILGPFRTKQEAQQQRESLTSKYPGCFIVTL